MNLPADRLRSAHAAALDWLLHSGVRAPDGSYSSIYATRERAYRNFYPMDSCMLSTAGAVVVLGRAGQREPALASAERVCELVIPDGPLAGAILAGRNSPHVLANWILFAVYALIEARELGGGDRMLTVATRAADFVIDAMQEPDGSIHQEFRHGSRGNALRRWLLPPHTWQVNCVEAFLRLTQVTGVRRYREAAVRHLGWVAGLQREAGYFPMYRHRPLTAAVAALRQRSAAELLRGCRVTHPACNTHAMKALALLGRVEPARRVAHWLAGQLGPHGLLYQFYYDDGSHCPEEDVMPTAHFGLVAADHPELGVEPEILERIDAGVAYAQIYSDDPDANGAMRGLPLHPESGEDAYTWDTLWSVSYLRRRLEGAAPADS